VVRSVFEDAIEDGLIGRNPARRVPAAGRDAKPRPALTVEQIRRLRAHLALDRLFGCWLLTLCGLRRSEVMGLRWPDLDLTEGRLTIERGRVLVDGKRTVEGKPKTKRGTRTLPLPADLLTALRAMRDAHAAANTCAPATSPSTKPVRRCAQNAGPTCGRRNARPRACPPSPCTPPGTHQ
jgi:integrase